MNSNNFSKYDEHGNEKPYKPRGEKNNTPPFLKRSLSDYFIRNNPKYANVFIRCPSCGKNGFVNIDYAAKKIQGRKCRECGFTNTSVE